MNAVLDTQTVGDTTLEETARYMATQLCRGFEHHDNRNRDDAVAAFFEVDRRQFAHLDEADARRAAVGYVDALWEKDAVEDAHRTDDGFDTKALDEADWSPVRKAFRRRADVAGIAPAYAELSTIGWRRHKTGGDYWTPLKRAQMYELRAALQDAEYPHKPRSGESGYGPEAARYELGVELHDMRRWDQAVTVMVPYFERILREHVESE